MGCTKTAPLGRAGGLKAAGCGGGEAAWCREDTSSGWALFGAAAGGEEAEALGAAVDPLGTAAVLAATWRREYTSSGLDLFGAAAAAEGAGAPGAATVPGVAAAAAGREGGTCRAPGRSGEGGEGAVPGTGMVAPGAIVAPALDATRGQSVLGAGDVPSWGAARGRAGTPTGVPV